MLVRAALLVGSLCAVALARNDIRPVVQGYGYPIETHTVTTADGYVLNVFRIPHGAKETNKDTVAKPVVFLQHGLEDSAATWLMGYPNESLGYIMADAGFDVWLGNARMTSYSNTGGFDYSWDEMAKYDLPAMVDLALKTSGRSSLVYVGHSQGTMMMFAGASILGQSFRDKISLFVALAPVAFLGSATAPLLQTIASIPNLDDVISFLDLGEFDPSAIPQAVCNMAPSICSFTLCSVAGCLSEGNLDEEHTKMVFQHFPDTTSWTNLVHYYQAVRSGKFQKFDYGQKGNIQAYGSVNPPQYDLSSWSTKAVLFGGEYDKLADPADVARVAAALPASKVTLKQIPQYGHGDFVWGMDAHVTLYPQIVSLATGADTEHMRNLIIRGPVGEDGKPIKTPEKPLNKGVIIGVAACSAFVILVVVLAITFHTSKKTDVKLLTSNGDV